MASFPTRRARLAAGVAVAALVAACAGGGTGSQARLAERSADAGDYQTAETLYRQAFDANPNSVDALIGLGRSYAGMGQYNRAEQALAEANRRRPNDPAVMLELARTELGAGQTEAAMANLDAGLKRRPHDVGLLTARGIALDRMSRHAEAQAAYREGLKHDPTDFALLSNLGLSLGLSGQTDQGITILRDLVRDPQANANTRGNLALVYGLAGREGDAKAALAGDLSSSQIQSNLVYYRELRGLLLKGRPITLDRPADRVRRASGAGQQLPAPPAPAVPLPAIAAAPVDPGLPVTAMAMPLAIPLALPPASGLGVASALPEPATELAAATSGFRGLHRRVGHGDAAGAAPGRAGGRDTVGSAAVAACAATSRRCR